LARAHLDRGSALSELGRLEEAVADATAAIDLEPGNTDTLARGHFVRAFVSSELGRTDEAVADLQTILRLLPPTHELSRLATGVLAALGISE
ncbi:MAG: tetratricopeptide repeat protein, partial [Actinobacteria bacterium]|nr:tetratricopeptide repeat protein [Actinomycetota bacterium]